MIPKDSMRVRTKPTPEQAEQLAKTYVSIFCDASFCPNTKAYGWAFWVKWDYPAQTHLAYGGGIGIKSPTEAEKVGCQKAIEWLASLDTTGKIIVLQCDNLDACAEAHITLQRFIKIGATKAYAKHVKGHRHSHSPRHYMNGICDKHAGEQMRHFRGAL